MISPCRRVRCRGMLPDYWAGAKSLRFDEVASSLWQAVERIIGIEVLRLDGWAMYCWQHLEHVYNIHKALHPKLSQAMQCNIDLRHVPRLSKLAQVKLTKLYKTWRSWIDVLLKLIAVRRRI